MKDGYVDRYDSLLLLWLLLIVALNILDASFTLLILDNGGWEVNPVARWAIEAFGDHFILWKLAVICSSMIILCLHCKFRMAQRVIYFAVLLYSGIVLYQIVLMTQVM